MKRMWSKNELKNIADARVQALVEGGALDNAKPIYCHPINFKFTSSSSRVYFLSCLLFNNDDTPFDASTWYDYVMGLITNYNAIIMTSGAVYIPDSTTVLVATNISTNGSDGMAVRGLKLNGSADFFTIVKSDITDPTAEFTDGVNPLNVTNE